VDLPPQNQAAAMHLFRLAQEAVSNAIKHGRASEISLIFKKDPDRIYLGISDNGMAGPAEPFQTHDMGLRIMQSRANMVGGTLTIERNMSGGTTVICSAPLPLPGTPAP
jgi:signal transduction histidine kinase